MNKPPEYIDELLKRYFPGQDPTAEDLENIRQVSRGLVAKHKRRSRTRRLGASTMALVLFLASLGVVEVLRSPPAIASLAEIAQAVRQIEPTEVPLQNFIYTKVHSLVSGFRTDQEGNLVAFQADYVSEHWRGTDLYLHTRTTTGEVRFYGGAAGRRYSREEAAALQLPEPGVATYTVEGVNSFQSRTDWPTDPRTLEALVRGETDGSDSQVFIRVVGLLVEPAIGRDLRAAAIDVLAGLNQTVTKRQDGSVSLSIRVERVFPAPTVETVHLSAEGYVIFHETVLPDGQPDYGIAPGTVVNQARWDAPIVVPSLDAP